ncbi:MAG: TIGR00730 family Rossman fold protein [Candidatus Dormibacteraceae bacterium]
MRICVFCGSRSGHGQGYLQTAEQVGELLAQLQIGLVYGGASIGCMGALADSALQARGEVIGVIPQRMVDREVSHSGLSHLHIVSNMHQRKALMADLSDAFLALPGGVGTLEELFEIWSWAHLELHAKPVGILNSNGYFAPLLQLVDQMIQADFIYPGTRDLLIVDSDPERLIARLQNAIG